VGSYARLYLAIETCAQADGLKDEDVGKNNDVANRKKYVFLKEKVIAIGALLRRPSASQSTCMGDDSIFRLFTDLRPDNERNLIREFYKWFVQLTQTEKIVVIGFDILRYDIPLLIQKGVEYGAGSIAELNKLWHNTHVIDYQQVALPYYNLPGKAKFPSLEDLAKASRSAGVGVPELCNSDGDTNTGEKVRICEKVNEDGEHNKIEKCLRARLEVLCSIDSEFKQICRKLILNCF